MLIKIINTINAVKDNEIYPTLFIKDNEYDLEGDLLDIMLKNNWAIKSKPIKTESKMDNQELENKMLDLKVENKKGKSKKEDVINE